MLSVAFSCYHAIKSSNKLEGLSKVREKPENNYYLRDLEEDDEDFDKDKKMLLKCKDSLTELLYWIYRGLSHLKNYRGMCSRKV